MGKIGRNDPCHCGSGKKYKKCCLEQRVKANESLDFNWRKLRQTECELADILLEIAEAHHGIGFMRVAWGEGIRARETIT